MGSLLTQAPVGVPSANRCEEGALPLRTASFPTVKQSDSIDADAVAAQWFGPEKIVELLKQTNGRSRIKSCALDKSSALRSPSASVIDANGIVKVVGASLSVGTDVGSGEGLVRLVQHEGTWKVFTLFTFLKELKGHEELVRNKRPNGVQHGEHVSPTNWLDRRKAEENFEDDEEPTVLILGAGQAGLTSAARLKMLGIKSLIVDREERIGDNWRTRYHQLVLHDPIWFDHLPYLPFPEHWPVFTPKDKFGDWFESYVKLLELNAWTQTIITKSIWDDASAKWTVTLERVHNGKTETRILHPKHIIQATGHSGEPNFPSHLKGLSTFAGSRLVHSSKFTGAIPSQGQNRRAIVVGCCNSGHDIAQDFYENGYHVTMIQRSTTCVVGAETMQKTMATLFGEGGPPTDDADMIFHSIPNQVTKRMNVDVTKAQNKSDKKTLVGLEKAGFKLDQGPDDSGLWIKYLQRGGGYYLDVGCSQLIIDGKIKVKQGCSISEVLPNGLKFDDGEVLEADEVVFATGYLNMRTQARKIFGDELADRVKDVWGFDEEGELRTVWRKSGHPGFWFMGGNLALCRWYSRLLALQIKGLEEGLCKYDDI